MARTLAIICSDEPRNGKTMLARVLADALSLAGPEAIRIFDTDFPHGLLAGYFPASSQIADFSNTQGQVTVFDTVIGEPEFDYIIDVDAAQLNKFFQIYHDIGFDTGAREAGIAITVYFMLDRALTSVSAAAKIRQMCGDASFVLVRNDAIGNVLTIPKAAHLYQQISIDREIVLPRLSIDALNLIDDPNFSFAQFVTSNGAGYPLEVKIELFHFLETVYNQRQVDESGGPVAL